MANKNTNITVVSSPTTLDMIAGYEEEKKEIKKIISIFKDRDTYKDINPPKGLILKGPPGCGKTLIASAIAGECGVPFYQFQCGDGDNTLKNLKAIFNKAEETKPSIIYIDEIDKLVPSWNYKSDKSRETVHFLLTKIDGLGSSSGVMVIASTNEYDDLPGSLTRSGRMDKKISIDVPDLDSRIKILEYYMGDKFIFQKVDKQTLALKIKSMSGADIKTLVNNALIDYAGDSTKQLEVDDFSKIINEMNFETIGKAWNNKVIASCVLAHEIGHAIVSYVLTGNHGSISAMRYNTVNGFTDFSDYSAYNNYDDSDKEATFSKKEALNDICCSLAGRAGEEVIVKSITAGCSGDIKQVERIVVIAARTLLFGFKNSSPLLLDETPESRNKMIKLKNKIVHKQYRRAKSIVKKWYYCCRFLVDKALEHNDSLSYKQLDEYIKYYSYHKKEIKTNYKHSKFTKVERFVGVGVKEGEEETKKL